MIINLKSFHVGFCKRFNNTAIIQINATEITSLNNTTVIGLYAKQAILNQTKEKLQKNVAPSAVK